MIGWCVHLAHLLHSCVAAAATLIANYTPSLSLPYFSFFRKHHGLSVIQYVHTKPMIDEVAFQKHNNCKRLTIISTTGQIRAHMTTICNFKSP